MIQDLEGWYFKLPPQMQLRSLSERDIPLEAKRSIYHVHLLYLGANMLLFRRIVAENIQIRWWDINISPLLWHPSSDLPSKQGPSALLTATSSAKIVKLLLDNNSIFQRCRLIMGVGLWFIRWWSSSCLSLKANQSLGYFRFQSYTSYIIIMHTILTKLVSISVLSSYEDEMKKCGIMSWSSCVLRRCRPISSSRRFHKKAQAVYNSVRQYIENYTEALKTTEIQQDVDM